MSNLSVTISWQRKETVLVPMKYSSAHQIIYNETSQLMGDAAADWGGDAQHTNPEQALAAALGSCHRMTFLALCAKAKWPLLDYRDQPTAHLGKNPQKKMAVNAIELSPIMSFDAGFEVSQSELEEMHDRAHRYCFIANSLSDDVKVTINL